MSTAPSLHCPLCAARRASVLETLDAAKIDRAYERSFGIRTSLDAARIHYARCDECGLRFFSPPSAGDAELYVQLQQHDWYYMQDKAEYAIAARWLPREGSVLEVGSGSAAFAETVGKRRYTGLEFNDAAIARAGAVGIALRKESVESHAAGFSGHYAAVVSFQVLEHVTDPRGFVTACIAALAPGGTLILAVPDHDGLCGLAQNNILDMPPHHVSHWDTAVLEHMATLFGIELVAIEREPIAPHHEAWAAKSLVERRLRGRFGLGPSVLDTSWFGRTLGHIAARWANSHPPQVAGVSGHTILACYRKTPAAQPVRATA